jgi:hypothetical protein
MSEKTHPDMWSVDQQLLMLVLLGLRFRVGAFSVFFCELFEQDLVHPIRQAVQTRMVSLKSLCAILLLVELLLFVLYLGCWDIKRLLLLHLGCGCNRRLLPRSNGPCWAR